MKFSQGFGPFSWESVRDSVLRVLVLGPCEFIVGAWVMFVVSPLTVIAETDPPPVNTTDRFRPVVFTAEAALAGSAGVHSDQNHTGVATVYCSAQVPPGGTVIMNAVADVATDTALTQ